MPDDLVIYSRATDIAGNIEPLAAPLRVKVAAMSDYLWLPLLVAQP